MKFGRLLVFGLLAAAVVVALSQVPDLTRYVKMKMM